MRLAGKNFGNQRARYWGVLSKLPLGEYLQAWSVLDERERLTFDLVTFCGLRESEAYGLKNGDLFGPGAIRVERSWFKGEINPTKTDEIREVGIAPEVFDRLTKWISTLPDPSKEGWVFPSEQIVTPMRPDNVLRRCQPPAAGASWAGLDQLCGAPSIAFDAAPGKGHGPKDHC